MTGDHLNLNPRICCPGKPKGIGNALWTCRSWFENEPFCLVYGDVLTDGNPFIPMLDAYSESGQDLALVTFPLQANSEMYTWIRRCVSKLVEKPVEVQANYVFAGMFILHSEIFPP